MSDPFTKLFAQMLAQSQEMARAWNPALEHFDMRALEKMVPIMPAPRWVRNRIEPVAVSDAYDGTWSIEVITTSGPCDRAYRYGVKLAEEIEWLLET